MERWKSLFKKKRPDQQTSDKAPSSASITIKPMAPPPRHFLGIVVAFSVDDFSIQMAAARQFGGMPRVTDIRKEYFPRKDFDLERKKEFIAAQIADFVAEQGGYWSEIRLTVSGRETAFRSFLMPIVKKAELDGAVRFEVVNQVPFPADDCIYDYRPIHKIVKNESSRYKIALQATTKRFMKEQLEPFKINKLTVSHVYHTLGVIGQLLKHLNEFDPEANYTLLNIGRGSTEISFYRGTTLEFFHISSASSAMLGSSGESTRYEYFAELIANEIQTSLDYYAGQYAVGSNTGIFVYGDLAFSNELLDQINKRGAGMTLVPFPVEKLKLQTDDSLACPESFPACLPVLAASVCQSSISDLRPEEDKIAEKAGNIHRYARVALAALLLIMVISWGFYNRRADIAADKATSVAREVEKFKNSVAFHAYNLLKRQIAIDRSYFEKIKESPSYLSLNLKELSNITPPTIRLSNFEYRKNEENGLLLQGLVSSSDVPPEVILAEFIEGLSASPFYEEVVIARHVKKTAGGKFQIQFDLTMKGII